MSRFAVLLASASLYLSGFAVAQSTYMKSMDDKRYGTPLTENPFAANQATCQTQCDIQTACVGFVWDTAGVCSLQSVMGNPNPQSGFISFTKNRVPVAKSSSGDYAGFKKNPSIDIEGTSSFVDIDFSDCPAACNLTVNCAAFTTNKGGQKGCWLLGNLDKKNLWENPKKDLFLRIDGPVPLTQFNYFQEIGISRKSESGETLRGADTGSLSLCSQKCSYISGCDGFQFHASTKECTIQVNFTTDMPAVKNSVTYVKGTLKNLADWVAYPTTFSYIQEPGFRRNPINYYIISADLKTCDTTCSNYRNCQGFLVKKSDSKSCAIVFEFDSKNTSFVANADYTTYLKKTGRLMTSFLVD